MTDSVQDAYQKILRSVSVREQSSARMRDKLSRAGFSDAVIDEALDRAFSSGAIDDKRYSDALIRSTLSAHKGLQFVLREIDELGVDPLSLDSYREYLEQGSEADLSNALQFLNEHPPRSKNIRESAYRKLLSKGYSSSIAVSAARTYSENIS